MELLPTASSTRKWALNGGSEICSRTFLFLGIGEGSFPTASLSAVAVLHWILWDLGLPVRDLGLKAEQSIPSLTTGKCSCQPHQGKMGWGGGNFSSWAWITDWCRAEVSFLTSILNLRFNLYFCCDLVFPVLLAKWSALMLVLAWRSHDMKCCPSQTSPTVPFSNGIFEKGLWVGTFKCWVLSWIYKTFKSPPVTSSFSVWPPVPSLEEQNEAGWSQNLKSL